ncbi:YiiD C-terminal domain-containing protein [Hahella ganghwensis]|uniref:YiiD C-terminal domain-containing protein n=1 Tax=Hahella ganghwensis TaxID=286420 RepID=UPI00036CC027|nr:YiiD C-terminal domain-containing protein [Hahella ganghwensis]
MIELLQNTFYSDIPITQAMKLQVLKYDGMSLTLRAPLPPNRNDKGTAFGGSLYSTAVLAGWGLIYLMTKERNLQADIMIHESHSRFIAPVTSDITATCGFDSEEQIEKALKLFHRRGLARFQLNTRINAGMSDAMTFEGSYAISR